MKVNKSKKQKIAILMIILSSTHFLFAEAPELRNVMPNSWQKVERVTGEEEQRVIAECDSNIREIIGMMNPMYYSGVGMDLTTEENNWHIKVYDQQIGADIFYRIFITDREVENYDTRQQHIEIAIWYKGENRITLGAGMYYYLLGEQYGPRASHICIEIIESSGKVKAVLISEVLVQTDDYPVNSRFAGRYMTNGEPTGDVHCYYYALNDYGENNTYHDYLGHGLITPDIPYIFIEGSPCLVDANSPLRYGLQSAFDGNPATSYVENTEDDLMWLQFVGISKFGNMDKIALINGYAQNENLYRSNNRIREIQGKWYEASADNIAVYTDCKRIAVNDFNMNYQLFDFHSRQDFIITDIYKGEKYNDTCLAELNISTPEQGWLFKEIENE